MPDRWRCVAEAGSDGRVVVDLLAGTPVEMVRDFTGLTGRPAAPPPAWVFGPWMSSNEWNTQARVEQEVALTQEHDIPATVLVIEAWSDETTFYIWNGARYTPRPGAEAPRLADFSFRPTAPGPIPRAWQTRCMRPASAWYCGRSRRLSRCDGPHAQHDADVAYALEQGYVMRRRDGSPYRNPAFWFHDAHLPDFTQAAGDGVVARQSAPICWRNGHRRFQDRRRGAPARAAICWPATGGTGANWSTPIPIYYVRAYHEFAQRLRNGDAITFSRAGYTGAGAFPAHWAGDENSTWEAYRRSIVAGLSAGLSGVLFWGWDIAGFSEALPSAELYLRATAMAAFCPIMQYHSEYRAPGTPSKDRTPWHIQARSGDERVIPIYRCLCQAAHGAGPLSCNAKPPMPWRKASR